MSKKLFSILSVVVIIILLCVFYIYYMAPSLKNYIENHYTNSEILVEDEGILKSKFSILEKTDNVYKITEADLHRNLFSNSWEKESIGYYSLNLLNDYSEMSEVQKFRFEQGHINVNNITSDLSVVNTSSNGEFVVDVENVESIEYNYTNKILLNKQETGVQNAVFRGFDRSTEPKYFIFSEFQPITHVEWEGDYNEMIDYVAYPNLKKYNLNTGVISEIELPKAVLETESSPVIFNVVSANNKYAMCFDGDLYVSLSGEEFENVSQDYYFDYRYENFIDITDKDLVVLESEVPETLYDWTPKNILVYDFIQKEWVFDVGIK